MELKKNKILPRKKFRHAFLFTCIASVVSIFLAIAPVFWADVEYDPTLAVLTATLVSLIWYTYFTYKAVNNEPQTQLDFGFAYQKDPALMSLSIQNQRHHHVLCTVSFSIKTAHGTWELPAPFSGHNDDQFHLKPGEAFHKSVNIQELIDSLPKDNRNVVVTATGIWEDEADEDGIIGPKSWAVGLDDQSMQRLYSKSEVDSEIQRIQGGA
jgi:hypothetical protein